MMGTLHRMAISWARSIFEMVSGHHDPAFTVASLATTTTSRPSTIPTPVITPAPGACPSYWSCATRRPTSTQVDPGSTRRSTRSRAVSLPWSCCLWMRLSPPPRRRVSRSSVSSRASWMRLPSPACLSTLASSQRSEVRSTSAVLHVLSSLCSETTPGCSRSPR